MPNPVTITHEHDPLLEAYTHYAADITQLNRTLKTPGAPNPVLTAYIHYVSEEGIDLHRFVEQGGRLLGHEDLANLGTDLGALEEKISVLREEYPIFGRQLEFLAGFIDSHAATSSPQARKEAAFALLYAAKDADLMPDHLPGVGFLDDAAVTAIVFARHSAIFQEHCAARGIEWDTVTEIASNA